MKYSVIKTSLNFGEEVAFASNNKRVAMKEFNRISRIEKLRRKYYSENLYKITFREEA